MRKKTFLSRTQALINDVTLKKNYGHSSRRGAGGGGPNAFRVLRPSSHPIFVVQPAILPGLTCVHKRRPCAPEFFPSPSPSKACHAGYAGYFSFFDRKILRNVVYFSYFSLPTRFFPGLQYTFCPLFSRRRFSSDHTFWFEISKTKDAD